MKKTYKLAYELDGQLLALEDDNTFRHVDTVAEADGIRFLCPKCFQENNGPIGTHSIVIFFSKCPKAQQLMGHSGWNAAGRDLSDLTFTGPGAASVLLKTGCKYHGFIKNGTASIL